jgi:glycosyltransferase involved in cell wall biosynthesis
MTTKNITSANIVQITSFYPPCLGGLERVAQEVSEQLAKDGYEVTVLTSDIGRNGAPRTETSAHLNVLRLRSVYFAHTAFIFDLLRQLMTIPKPAIFHLHLAQAYTPEMVWLAAKLRRIPYVVHFHLDVEPSGFFGRVYPLYKKYILARILQDADRIIVFSQEQRRLLVEKYGIQSEHIIIIPNGVSRKFFLDGKRGIPVDVIKLLYVGRFTNQKRVDRLINAIALLDFPVTLKIVGDGEDRKQLMELARALALKNITFEGKKVVEELLAYYREADIFVIPSEREGMPLTILEAMASGLPIVGSNVMGIRELIEDVGILVDDPSPETFAKALASIHEKPEILQTLSAKSREKAELFSWERLAKNLAITYNELLK